MSVMWRLLGQSGGVRDRMGQEVRRVMQSESAADETRAGLSQDCRRFLVVYATRYGSTKGVADAIAGQLRNDGHDVDVESTGGVTDLSGYDALVVGGPMIRGWHKDAMRFLSLRRGELAGRPLAYFITAATLTEDGRNEVDGVPVVKDPSLVRAPRNEAKLRFKEKYALPRHYLGDILAGTAPLRPRAVAFFAGSLDLMKMRFFDKLFVLLIVGASPGDRRDWKTIREWAAGLPAVLK